MGISEAVSIGESVTIIVEKLPTIRYTWISALTDITFTLLAIYGSYRLIKYARSRIWKKEQSTQNLQGLP